MTDYSCKVDCGHKQQWCYSYLRVGSKYVCPRPGPREGKFEGILVGILSQLHGAAVYDDHANWFSICSPLEVEKEVAFQHKPTPLKRLIQLATLIQETLLVNRS